MFFFHWYPQKLINQIILMKDLHALNFSEGSYYLTLGLNNKASKIEIEEAYKTAYAAVFIGNLILKPNIFGRFLIVCNIRALTKAYNVLSNAHLRKEHDEMLVRLAKLAYMPLGFI